jgi:uncharacterized protein (TIGR03086 family)
MDAPTLVDVREVYRRASAAFSTAAHRIGDRWQAPTPCADWDVRQLLHHIVEEERWTPPLFAGETIASVGDRFAGDLLGNDPLASLDDAAAAAFDAVRADGAMERTVHLSFGDFAGREYALQLAADHLVHAWDMARAVGADETLDPETVVVIRDWFRSMEQAYRDAGVIGPRPPVTESMLGSASDPSADADPQVELLAMFGRTP